MTDSALPPAQARLLDYRMPSRVEEIARLADAVEAALSARPELAFPVNLCLEELITNTILHGLGGEPDHEVRVVMSLAAGWLDIFVLDDAMPFDPFAQAPPPHLDDDVDERPIGGLGVYMVRTLMDETRAHYTGTGNLIHLRKQLQALPPSS